MNKISDIIRNTEALIAKGTYEQALNLLRDYIHSCKLKLSEVAAIDRVIIKISAHQPIIEEYPLTKIAIISGVQTSSLLARAINCSVVAEGKLPEIFEGDFNDYQIQILDSKSGLYGFAPDLIVIAVSWRDVFNLSDIPVSKEAANEFMIDHVNRYMNLWDNISANLKVPVIQHLFDQPGYNFLGLSERHSSNSAYNIIDRLNKELIEAAPGYVSWVDINTVSHQVGLENWHSEKIYFQNKIPFNTQYIAEYGAAFAATYRSLIARSKKCLIIDLDNTLWGGVIGDDGLEGIQFGQGSYSGEAFLDFARYLKAIKNQGVILAICSKNEPDVALSVFEERSDMPLSLDDFSAIRCNWIDKASNIREIINELNISPSSVVFIDDNPAECELVRRELPIVTTICLPEDVSTYTRFLDGMNLFSQQKLTQADLTRTQSYNARVQADKLKSTSVNLNEFLQSLEMRSVANIANKEDIPRLAQMENRTNQFNLTTKRYSEGQLEEMLNTPDIYILAISLKDKFADHGMISSVIAVKEDNILRIDSWMMSCRVFSRTVEHFAFNKLVKIAQDTNSEFIVGEYLETERNKIFKNHYNDFGFSQTSKDNRWWEYSINSTNEKPHQTFISHV